MSRRILAVVAAALALAVATGCSTTKKEEKPVPLSKIHSQFVPKRIWSKTVGETKSKLQLALAPAIDGTRVYGVNAEGDVVALELANGRSGGWLKTPMSAPRAPAAGCVGMHYGRQRCAREADGAGAGARSSLWCSPRWFLGVARMRTVDGKLFALEMAGGKQRWVADRQVPRLTLRGTSPGGRRRAGDFGIRRRLMAVTMAAGIQLGYCRRPAARRRGNCSVSSTFRPGDRR